MSMGGVKPVKATVKTAYERAGGGWRIAFMIDGSHEIGWAPFPRSLAVNDRIRVAGRGEDWTIVEPVR